MKRLLTYGLLLLTILAGHFVVSACQDDLPENTEIMVTFTTRAISGGDDSDSPVLEQMHDLSVIMLRSDGTIVGKDSYEPKEGEKNPSSVIFSFSTTIPNPSGEDFTFLAIANEKKSIDEALPWQDLSVGQTLSESAIKALKINTDINNKPMPQTDYWTVHVPQEHNHKVKKTLQFAGSKISVVFNNMTKEEQSLSKIRITGITPNTQGYLFKQDGTDYIDSKDDNATQISFDNLTLAAPTTVDGKTIYASDSVSYYTYPLGKGNISSPMLYADWNGEQRELSLNRIKDKEGNEIDFTSLARNEHLRIEITLTPAGDITVNYTIAPWEDTPTTIGGEAPTTPDNDNEYNTEDWGASNDIEIGGGAGENDWTLSDGTIIGSDQVLEDWSASAEYNSGDYLSITIPSKELVIGNKVLVDFYCLYKNCPKNSTFRILFTTDQSQEGGVYQSIESANSTENIVYEFVENKNYVRYLTIDDTVLTALKASNGQLVMMTIESPLCTEGDLRQHPYGIKITKYALIKQN